MTDSTREGAARSWVTLVGATPRTLWGRHDVTARPLPAPR